MITKIPVVRGPRQPAASGSALLRLRCNAMPQLHAQIDEQLSNRALSLDEAGYFIISADGSCQEIVAEYFPNIINAAGEACDPNTGEVIPCGPGYTRAPKKTFRGKTAKELSVQILEQEENRCLCSHMEHANYLGREFQKAEFCLLTGETYVQD